ncbi:MAG TPA: DUF4129 domain-containing protein [Thermoanaerobaculia bacterium]
MKRLLLVLSLALSFALPAQAMPIHEYAGALERLHGQLRANQLDVAHAEARALMQQHVELGTQRFRADDSLLHAIATSKKRDARLLTRLAATIVELRRIAPAGTVTVDPKLLETIAKEEAVDDLQAGGDALPVDPDLTLSERIAKITRDVLEWIVDKLDKLWRWLARFWPKSEPGGGSGMTSWFTIVTVGLIVAILLLLAIKVLRRSRAAEPETVESSEPLGSRKDEDPLSRGAGEWEKYAAQLAAAGRIREAIRAWYHAVLVTCYAAGILHFRKGRTNWEYISLLGPQVPWRPELMELTRRFEVEWYGHTESTAEALDDCSTRARRILDAIRRARSAA